MIIMNIFNKPKCGGGPSSSEEVKDTEPLLPPRNAMDSGFCTYQGYNKHGKRSSWVTTPLPLLIQD